MSGNAFQNISFNKIGKFESNVKMDILSENLNTKSKEFFSPTRIGDKSTKLSSKL